MSLGLRAPVFPGRRQAIDTRVAPAAPRPPPPEAASGSAAASETRPAECLGAPTEEQSEDPERRRDRRPKNCQENRRDLVAVERRQRHLNVGPEDPAELEPELHRVAVADLRHVLVAEIGQDG